MTDVCGFTNYYTAKIFKQLILFIDLPVEKLLDFNKLADLLKAHNKDLDFLTSAILKSEVLSFSDDHKMVKRKFPLPEVDDSKERTLVIVCYYNYVYFKYIILIYYLVWITY